MSMKTRRLIAALAATTVLSTGAATIVAPAAVAAPAATAAKAPRPGNGPGKIIATEEVAPGSIVTVTGTGLKQRPADGFLAFKLDDAALKFPEQTGADGEVDESGTVTVDDASLLPDAKGDFSVKLRLPEDISEGQHWVRLLVGNDGGEPGSYFATFNVSASANTAAEDETKEETKKDEDVTIVEVETDAETEEAESEDTAKDQDSKKNSLIVSSSVEDGKVTSEGSSAPLRIDIEGDVQVDGFLPEPEHVAAAVKHVVNTVGPLANTAKATFTGMMINSLKTCEALARSVNITINVAPVIQILTIFNR